MAIPLETRDNKKIGSVGLRNGLALVSNVNYCQTKKSLPLPNISQVTINHGLAYILNHFRRQAIWSRAISTKGTEGRQVIVNSEKAALTYFKSADWLDCRISAYPPNATVNPSGLECFQGLRITTPRNLIVIIDLDKSTFRSDRALQLALTRTLQKINLKLKVKPTVLWSGNGYHVYLVLDSQVNLENVKQFVELNLDEVSLKFLRFAETFLSCSKSDKAHNTTVSFNNCMMRIPGSINSKNNSEVKIIQQWNGVNRPGINYLLADFCVYLANKKARELREQQRQRRRQQPHNGPYTLQWIEKLLEQIPITNGRKYCIWRILVPYLINRRHVSQDQCIQMVKTWLDQCSNLERLNFNASQRINDAIKRVGTYGPVYPDKLSQEYPELYELIADKVLE